MKTVVKKSRGSFEDFLEQLSEVRLSLEADRNVVRAGSREKLYRPPKEGSRSKSSKRVRTQEEQGQGSFSS